MRPRRDFFLTKVANNDIQRRLSQSDDAASAQSDDGVGRARAKKGRRTVVGADCVLGPHSVVGAGSILGAGSVLGAFAFFAPGAVAGARIRLGPGACVGPESNLGADVVMHAHAAVKHCDVGDGAVLHQHASAGDDGFGFFVDENEATCVKCVKKKPQTLRVNVGARCEIGAGSRVDRGSWRDTVLGSNTKLDNLVHVGHNARIGANVLLCGGVAIGGSAEVGDFVAMGGKSAARDHVSICAGARIAAKAGVTRDILKPGDYAGFPAVPAARWRRDVARRNTTE
jgi:UDP-3-O-[3-hydroxymyristoyl] glucosamine N-acyltransferase LpxD